MLPEKDSESDTGGSVELGQLFRHLVGAEREIGRSRDGFLALAAQDEAEELADLRWQRLARLAVQADIQVAGERVAAAGRIGGIARDEITAGLRRHGDGLQTRTAFLEA